MSICERVQRQLSQYVADGAPRLVCYTGLRAHLRSCVACRALARQLSHVEDALTTLPMVVPDPILIERIVRVVDLDRQGTELCEQPGEWRLFPWDIWVPALTLVLALSIVGMSVPAHLLPWKAMSELENMPVNWTSLVDATKMWFRYGVDPDRFWAIWIGAFVALAGLGLSMSLSSWDLRHRRRLDHLESQASDVAQRLRELVRRI